MSGQYQRWPATGGGGSGTVTAVTATSPVVSSGGTTPDISMHVADSTHDGYLSSSDYLAFKAKLDSAISHTYAELAALISGSSLVVGQFYLMTDFATHYIIPKTTDTHTGSTEPLLLIAMSNNAFESSVFSPSYPQDIILYEFVDSTSSGADRGRITFRHDTQKDNYLYEDFRNTYYRRWNDGSGKYVIPNDYPFYPSDITDYQDLSSIDTDASYSVHVGPSDGSADGYTNTIFNLSTRFTAFNNFLNNTAVFGFRQTTALSTVWTNIWYTECSNSVLGNSFQRNLFLDNCSRTETGNNFQDNVFSMGIEKCKIGIDFSQNSFAAFVSGCIIKNGFWANVFTGNLTDSTIDNDFNSNTVKNISNLTIGYNANNNNINCNSFDGNIIGDNFNNNDISIDYFENNILFRSFSHNTISNKTGDSSNFSGNTAYHDFTGNVCNGAGNNTFGASFQDNTVGNGFNKNNIEPYTSGLTYPEDVFGIVTIGQTNPVSGASSGTVCIGHDNTLVDAGDSLVLGPYNSLNGAIGNLIGRTNTILAPWSDCTAVGSNNTLNGDTCFAFGDNNRVNATRSMAVGSQIELNNRNRTGINSALFGARHKHNFGGSGYTQAEWNASISGNVLDLTIIDPDFANFRYGDYLTPYNTSGAGSEVGNFMVIAVDAVAKTLTFSTNLPTVTDLGDNVTLMYSSMAWAFFNTADDGSDSYQVYRDRNAPPVLNLDPITNIIRSQTDIEITDITKGIIMTDTVLGGRYRGQLVSGVLTWTAI